MTKTDRKSPGKGGKVPPKTKTSSKMNAMDVRNFFGRPKTETKTPTSDSAFKVTAANCLHCVSKIVVGVAYGTCKECAEKWKQAIETPRPAPEGLTYEFEFTLGHLLRSDELMEGSDDKGFELFTRVPTEDEWKWVVYSGKTLRLPYNWRWDYPDKNKFYEIASFTIPEEQWAKGERWTMRRVVDKMRSFYGASKGRRARSMGDHQFFEGFGDNGEPYFGS